MPDDNTTPAPISTPPVDNATPEPTSNDSAASSVVVDPLVSEHPSSSGAPAEEGHSIQADVAHKIAESKNVLVALSSDPSVDEISAAIGLSLFLDKIGKNTTAIYSGSTPNALEFLKPEETFETSADVLQDFVVALNKEKADHLRYKIDGDYVKIYITPYHTRVSEEDLEFSHGDYNVDLVLALDVANGIDLDAALREHGRIMHDASIINITTGNPGKFGEIEWSDKTASSVSEMIASLIYNMNTKEKLDPEEATAFLTGIVAATDRFSSASTTSETMKLSSKLMESGANQQLISQNITDDIENELFNMTLSSAPAKTNNDPTSLDIEHDPEVQKSDNRTEEKPAQTEPHSEAKPKDEPSSTEDSALLDDLQAAAASLAQAGSETIPTPEEKPVEIDSPATPTPEEMSTPAIETGKDSFGQNDPSINYGQMVEDALANSSAPVPGSTKPIMSEPENPAAANAPAVPENPEINGVPQINYMPTSSEDILPPPPAPPIGMDTIMPTPEPTPEPTIPTEPIAPPAADSVPSAANNGAAQPLGPQPAMQDQIYNPQAADPGAFKIPGM